MKSIIVNWEKVNEILLKKNVAEKLDGLNYAELKSLVNLFEPFKEASDDLESTKKPTLYLCLPYYFELLKYTETQAIDSRLIKNLKKIIRTGLQNIWYPETTLHHKTATFLFPPCRQLSNIERAEKQSIYAFIKDLAIDFPDDCFGISDEIPSSSNSSISEDSMFSIFSTSNSQNICTYNSVAEEIQGYIEGNLFCSDSCDIIEWWNENQEKFRTLYQVFLKLYCIPAPSAASKRCFSVAGNFLTEKRSNLDPDKLDKLIILQSMMYQRNI